MSLIRRSSKTLLYVVSFLCFLAMGVIDVYRLLRFYMNREVLVFPAMEHYLIAEAALCFATVLLMLLCRKKTAAVGALWLLAFSLGMYEFLNPYGAGEKVFYVQSGILILSALLMVFHLPRLYSRAYEKVFRRVWLVLVFAQIALAMYLLMYPGRSNPVRNMMCCGFVLAILSWMGATLPGLKKLGEKSWGVAFLGALAIVLAPYMSDSAFRAEELLEYLRVYVTLELIAVGIAAYAMWLRSEVRRELEREAEDMVIQIQEEIIVVDE